MAGPLRRFLHLERRRADGTGPSRPGEDGPRPPGDGGPRATRFDALERAAPAAGVPGGAPPLPEEALAGRFRAPPAPGLDLAEGAADAQPFVRCCRCETDNSLHAGRCTTCQAELRTDAQRAFNERLWAARLEQREAEARAHAERQAALDEEERRDAAARRAAYEQLARAVGAQERRRLEGHQADPVLGDGAWGDPDAASDHRPGPALRLLLRLPLPWQRWAAGGAALLLPALLWLAGWRRGAALATALLLALAVPPAWWLRRTRRW